MNGETREIANFPHEADQVLGIVRLVKMAFEQCEGECGEGVAHTHTHIELLTTRKCEIVIEKNQPIPTEFPVVSSVPSS